MRADVQLGHHPKGPRPMSTAGRPDLADGEDSSEEPAEDLGDRLHQDPLGDGVDDAGQARHAKARTPRRRRRERPAPRPRGMELAANRR